MTEQGSRAPRRPTADPRRFLIPEEHLPPGFAERVDDPTFQPAETRPAATVVVAREGADSVEVLLLRRPQRSGFAAGAWVFPGGRVDPADADPGVLGERAEAVGARWALRLGLSDPAEARGFVVASLREAWEETGILVGEASAPPGRIGELRRALLEGTLSLTEAVREGGVRFDLDDLLYLAHWITPEPEPRRYDTRFFLARVDAGVECALEGEELCEARWVRPADAVVAFGAGEMVLLPPTVDTLRRLSLYGDLPSAWAELRETEVPSILPRMKRDPGGVLIEY
jgi:8-oxo-dGTP pyrophosphatase MutT (NUDIX family)